MDAELEPVAAWLADRLGNQDQVLGDLMYLVTMAHSYYNQSNRHQYATWSRIVNQAKFAADLYVGQVGCEDQKVTGLVWKGLVPFMVLLWSNTYQPPRPLTTFVEEDNLVAALSKRAFAQACQGPGLNRWFLSAPVEALAAAVRRELTLESVLRIDLLSNNRGRAFTFRVIADARLSFLTEPYPTFKQSLLDFAYSGMPERPGEVPISMVSQLVRFKDKYPAIFQTKQAAAYKERAIDNINQLKGEYSVLTS